MTNNNPKETVQSILKTVRRVVIKVGTRVIDDEKTHFNRPVIESLVNEIAALMKNGVEVILVTSGAVGAGIRALGVSGKPKSLHLRQAYAAIGQGRLMQVYGELFDKHGVTTAQVLLARSDLDQRSSYLNAQQTLQHLLQMGIIPIINENDTVAVEELKFGDNDQLAALVAGKMNAQLLMLLTTVDGIMRGFDPATKQGELIEYIDDPAEEICAHIDDKMDSMSLGGMRSKFFAARTACAKGVLVAIANGHRTGIVQQVISGEARTSWMIPSDKQMASWKYYLAYAKRPSGGTIAVDAGAVQAVRENGKSLLAKGVKSINGTFSVKALVQVTDETGREFARGLVNYSSEDLKKIIGRTTDEINEILNNDHPAPVIHRDNLVLL